MTLKSFFDTSVLLSTFLTGHLHHEPSLQVMRDANPDQSFCAAHSMAEIYATATRMPRNLRVGGDQILLFVQSVHDRLSIVALTSPEYFAALENAAAKNIIGGTVYDALIAACALKAGADVLYTWNIRHFERFGPEVSRILRSPSS